MIHNQWKTQAKQLEQQSISLQLGISRLESKTLLKEIEMNQSQRSIEIEMNELEREIWWLERKIEDLSLDGEMLEWKMRRWENECVWNEQCEIETDWKTDWKRRNGERGQEKNPERHNDTNGSIQTFERRIHQTLHEESDRFFKKQETTNCECRSVGRNENLFRTIERHEYRDYLRIQRDIDNICMKNHCLYLKKEIHETLKLLKEKQDITLKILKRNESQKQRNKETIQSIHQEIELLNHQHEDLDYRILDLEEYMNEISEYTAYQQIVPNNSTAMFVSHGDQNMIITS